MVRQDALEFVISKRAVSHVYNVLEKRVNHLFDVSLSRAIDEVELHDEQWLKLEGNKSEFKERAKEYIIAACSPETKFQVPFPNGFEDELREKIEEVERSCCAFISVNTNQKEVVITGSDFAVGLAVSSLEEAIHVFSENSSCGTDSNVKSVDQINNRANQFQPDESLICTGIEEKLTISDKENLDDSNSSTNSRFEGDKKHLECADESSENMREDLVKGESEDKLADDSCDAENELEESRESEDSSPASAESLRDFASKLGYSETHFDCALGKLGQAADKNSLLHELVKREASVKQLEEGPCATFEKTIPPVEDADCLRPVVVDGSNVAMSHGNQRVFSCRGIGITVDWFLRRGHRDIKVFVPLWRKESPRPDSPITDQEVLSRLEQDRFLVWTPSRKIQGRRVVCYDDRFIIRLAAENDGVIVSNDTFRDLQNESTEWKKVIEQRLLMYSFVNDMFMPPDDPLGRHGPTLEEFLRKGCGKLCPYGQRCTYGKRCKFLHPERNSKTEEVQGTVAQNAEQLLLLSTEVPYGNVQREPKPLPPPPDMPQYLLTKPLPPPPWEFPQRMMRMFPPILRSPAVNPGFERPISDPLPHRSPIPPDMTWVRDDFQRTRSMPCFEPQPCDAAAISPRPPLVMERRGSVPQIPEGYATAHSSHSTVPAYGANHQDIVARGIQVPMVVPSNGRPPNDDWIPDEAIFSAGGYQQYAPRYPPAPSPSYDNRQPHNIPSSHWRMTRYSQQQYPAQPPPPHYQYSAPVSNANAVYYSEHQRTPYRGQRNGYFRSRAPPIIGCGNDETDQPGEGASDTELRIRAYEKLVEVFPDDVEKILKVLDEHPEVTSVEELTQYLL